MRISDWSSDVCSSDLTRQVDRFVDVERIGAAMAHITEGAATRTLVAHDHERGRAFAKALAYVRARGLFAHSMQIMLAQDFLDEIGRASGRERVCQYGSISVVAVS